MKLRSVFFAFMLFAPAFAFAQQQAYGERRGGSGEWDNQSSTLSVYSENGEQFLLVLNGVSQNTVPTTKIRVERLPKYGNDIEILFADNRTPAIRKTITIADPVDNKPVNMTLKLVRNHEGQPRLKFHSCTEVQRDYHPERDEYVMDYGQHRRDNDAQRTNNENVPPPPPPAPLPMDEASFNDMKTTIKNISWDETRLSTAKTILNNNYMTVAQVTEIAKLFGWDEGRMSFVKAANPKTIDQGNFYKIGSIFTWDTDKTALNDFINAQPH